MDSVRLSFCRIIKLNDSIAEVIVNDGVEIDSSMLEEYHEWIENNLADPCGLLINKINRYTYTFNAQLKIADAPNIQAIAVVTYTRIAEVATKILTKLPREKKWNLEMFQNREEALTWLENELQK